ncbi:hypothetical protein L596_007497 [Steinernema carpocapsae]|uniref:Uncharacterized protein n=1 Tax=Steinernema carpocapsae TaxID=34508 RepID=A0A4U5P9J9_STECR|nr:hypothetical protein L596_007497 [Steinernema carpocapsae]
MHEVAEGALAATSQFVLTAASFAEVGDRRELGVNRLAVEPAVLQGLHTAFGVVFAGELHVNVADHVFSNVVAHVHLLNLAVLLVQFGEDLLEEVVEVILFLFVVLADLRKRVRLAHVDDRVVVEVFQQNRLGERRHDVRSGALVAMTACADLEIEGAVNFILLSSVNGSQILGSGEMSHGCGWL